MKPETLNELALFAGAGGGILGGKLRGWRTVCAVEWDAYARDVLVARQNDGCLEAFPIWDDVQTFDGRPWQGRVDVVSGGFPCQDISAAGKGAGIEGERSGMWKHMARIIGEVLPRLVFVENSPMLVGRGLGTVLADLTKMGYDARWGVVGAHHVAAPHKRDRIWIIGTMGNTDDDGQAAAKKRGSTPQGGHASPARKIEAGQSARPSEQLAHVADTESTRLERHRFDARQSEISQPWNNGASKDMANAASSQDHGIGGDCECGRVAMGRQEQTAQQDERAPDHHRACGCRGAWWGSDPAEWPTESRVGRVAHGVACRVDRLRCIGNGQVPAVVPLAWNLLRPTTDEIQ